MKKSIFFIILLLISVLSACSSKVTSLTKVENVPVAVRESIKPEGRLQLKEENKNGYYITFQSDGDVNAHYDVKGDIVEIKFDVSNPHTEEKKLNVYYLTTDKDIDTIEVYINEERSGFDIIS